MHGSVSSGKTAIWKFAWFPVGASLLAMDVNDDAFFLNERVVLRFFASKLAPTEKRVDPNCIF